MIVFGFLIAMVITAWSARGLTLLLGRSKTNTVNRVDDVAQDETIPMNEAPTGTNTTDEPGTSSEATFDTRHVAEILHPPSPTVDVSRIRGPGVDLPSSRQGSIANLLNEYQNIRLPTTSQKTAAFVTANIDALSWSFLWVIGFGVYMGTGYSMPAQLPLNILTFFAAMRISPSARRFIHPIFPCAAFTILGIFILAAIKGESLDQGHLSQCRADIN
jgi:hypothetical protein